ncbi:Glycosyltransferase involved in cell wall bisynthesis [Hyunsoonleella jejuensis]|uniref:Glycosyltransferase involved in cell wall bisynthesis n=1 Tax=Hyunsoonleella jejuensis TaxID=419940 RepID=A0A1H9J9F6_9FLAO|nr:Glycosyltransferase involved in cell wall bisynthesis [Hyunsoonleella jejuensis]
MLTTSLSSGGAEKMAANMSISLCNRGYDVVVVSMKDEIDYDFSGKLYNFGKVKAQYSRLQAFFKFQRFFKKHQFDVIIDHRVRDKFVKEFLFSKLVFGGSKVVYCVHHYMLGLYFSMQNIPMLSRLTLVKNRKIVVVSKVAKQKIKQQLQLESKVIYNYTLENKEVKGFNSVNTYILAVGRLEKIKQFDVLIKAFSKSQLPKNNIKLLILGKGIEQASLSQLILKLNLKNHVEIVEFKKNVDAYIKQSKALVMSSASEGFPMVLIEALALKTPVISFDCKSGPNEIIQSEVNGLLVEDQNSVKLTEALDRLILNDVFYNKIKGNLERMTNPFSEKRIIEHWVNLLENF